MRTKCTNPEILKLRIDKRRKQNSARQRKFYNKNKDRLAAEQKARAIKNPLKQLLYMASSRAKKMGIAFSISETDFLSIPDRCPILGIEISFNNPMKNRDHSISLDRIIPELGYIPGNVRLISFRANNLKNNATKEELEKVLADFYSREAL